MTNTVTSILGFFVGAFVVQTLLSLTGLGLSADPPLLFLVTAVLSLIMTASAFVGQYVGDRAAAPLSILWSLTLGAVCPAAVLATTIALDGLGATPYILVASFVLTGFVLGWIGNRLKTAYRSH